MGLLQDGFNSFNAQERELGDGKPSCGASMTATSNGQTATFYGHTKNLHGHAEIDALYQFLRSIDWDENNFGQYTLTVQCKDKNCCLYCSAIMGLLRINADNGTYKFKKTMGVSYALPPDIRKFLARFLGVRIQEIESELTA